jgi:hypothetical protein
MPKVGWGAAIQGETMDLAAWAHVLKEPFDPWVETHGSETVLRSTSLDELESVGEVRDQAIAYIDRLNGAMAVSQHSRPVRFGAVIRFEPDGSLHRTAFLETVMFEARSSVVADSIHIGPDGQPVPPPPPQPSEVQRWATLADDQAWLEDALVYFGRATDWFDIYKALECLILRFGGSEAKFLALNWAPATEVQRLKRTANWVARHAERKFDRAPNPMTLKEARQLVGELLRRAFEEAAK